MFWVEGRILCLEKIASRELIEIHVTLPIIIQLTFEHISNPSLPINRSAISGLEFFFHVFLRSSEWSGMMYLEDW